MNELTDLSTFRLSPWGIAYLIAAVIFVYFAYIEFSGKSERLLSIVPQNDEPSTEGSIAS